VKIKGIFLAAILTAVLFISGNLSAATYGGGSGTSGDPYLIATAADMNSIGANSADWGKCFKLIANINMSIYTGTQYKIIGNSNTLFTGTFDGNGHIVRNLTYTTTALDNVGLFGAISNAIIKNLGVENVNLSGGGCVGVLVAYQGSGTITNCYSTGLITSATSYAGGLVAYQDSSGTISDCYSSVSVTVDSSISGSCFAGGLVGNQRGSITNCYSTGSISAYDSLNYDAYAGGLVGRLVYGSITNCFSTATVISSSSGPYGSASCAGGLVGMLNNTGTIANCYSTGSVTSSGPWSYAGGLLGRNYGVGDITNCHSTGIVTSSTPYGTSGNDGSYAGGLIGYHNSGTVMNSYSTGVVISSAYSDNCFSLAGGLVGQLAYGTITNCFSRGSVISSATTEDDAGGLVGSQLFGAIANCYSTGSVSSSAVSTSYAGGLVGEQYNDSRAIIEKCYSIGQVSATGSSIYKGGLLGFKLGSSGTVSACFWDINTSGTSDGVGNVDPDPSGAMGKTTAEMMMLATFTSPPASWDFTNETTNGTNDYWMMLRQGEDYPRLAWQPVIACDIAGLYGVNAVDFAVIAAAWQSTPSSPNWNPVADLNSDGVVNFLDILILSTNWLEGM
jgi:hypothetical protein